MANLLLDPNLWADGSGSPPSSWDGSSYVVSVGSGTSGAFWINYSGAAPSPGDTLAGSAVQTNTTTPEPDVYLCLVETNSFVVLQSVRLPAGVPVDFSWPALEHMRLVLSSAPDSPYEASLYGLNLSVTPAAPEEVRCEEHGRVTRAYVSGYQRDRVHRSRLVRGERRCLVANFNGAIPPARTIASATWRCDQNQAVYMANPRITDAGRVAEVDITAQIGWGARVKCEAVLDNGEVYTQRFVIRVVSAPYFMGEPTWYAQGPTELTATA